MEATFRRHCRKTGAVACSLVPGIMLAAPFVHYWFFAACIVLGVDYDESAGDGFYGSAVALLCVVCCILLLDHILRRNEPFNKACWLFICFVGLILIDLIINSTGFQRYNYLSTFVAFCLMGVFAGLYLSNDDQAYKAMGVLDVVATICFLGGLLFEIAQYSSTVWSNRGYAGLSYQTISYMSSAAYSISLWSIEFAKPEQHYRMLNGKAGRIIRIALVPSSLAISALSGGRGGVLSMAVVTAAVLILLIRAGRIKVKAWLVIAAATFLVFAGLFVWGDSLLQYRGIERIFTGGDNRSNVWGSALEAIADAPLLGYGFGGYGTAFDGPYPHNIVLDILLSTGFVGLALFICFMLYLLKRVSYVLKANSAWGSLLVITGIFSLVYLSVSGTFLSYSPFWFVIAALISYGKASIPTDGND